MFHKIIQKKIIRSIFDDPLAIDDIKAYSADGFDPEFVLDFTTRKYFVDSERNKTFSDVVTHSRSGNATMTDSDGNIKWAPHNLQRYSNAFDNAGWIKTNSTITANATTAPDGTNTAFKYTSNSTSSDLNNATAITSVDGVSYTSAIFVKKDVSRWFRIYTDGGSTWFDLQNGVVGTSTADSSSIEDVGNGWFLCKATDQSVGSAFAVLFMLHDSDNTSLEENGGTAFIWGAHVYRSDLGGMVANPEQPLSRASYVPTTSSAKYLPRIGHHVYSGSAYVNEGLLAESESRTNQFQRSLIQTAYWDKSSVTLTDNATTAPDGTTTATNMVANNNATVAFTNLNTSVTSGTTYTQSFYAKAKDTSWIQIAPSTGFTNAYQNFDLSNGVLGAGDVGIANIQDVGNGWYRCSITVDCVATSSAGRMVIAWMSGDDGRVNSDGTFTPDGTQGVYVWGAQLEAGSTPSSYIPTSGATVTRAAETFTIPSANLPWNDNNVSIAMDGRVTYADGGNFVESRLYQWFDDADNRIQVYLDTNGTNTGRLYFYQEENNVADFVQTSATALSPGVLDSYNIASRHGSTFINGALDGTALTANTTPTALADLSSTNLSLAYNYMGTIGTFRIWDQDITDDGLEDATD